MILPSLTIISVLQLCSIFEVDGLFINDASIREKDSIIHAGHDHLNTDEVIWSLAKLSEFVAKIKSKELEDLSTQQNQDTDDWGILKLAENLGIAFQRDSKVRSQDEAENGDDENSDDSVLINPGINIIGGTDPPVANSTANSTTATPTTTDIMEQFCEIACVEGLAGPECDCPDTPIG